MYWRSVASNSESGGILADGGAQHSGLRTQAPAPPAIVRSSHPVRTAFLTLAVENRYDPAVPALEEFLTMQGRRKFVRPLITALAEDKEWGRPIAVRVYRKARPGYHPVTIRDLDKLGLL